MPRSFPTTISPSGNWSTYLGIIRSFSMAVASVSCSRPKCRKKKFKLVRLSALPTGAMRP
jgi:hypothetical protein